MDTLIQLDKQLLVFLNSFGSETFDPFWLFITKQLNWIPFFLIVMYYLYKKLGLKKLGITILFLALLILCTDQFTNLVKYNVQRLRPCNDLQINEIIRVVKCSNTYSFFSGHASNSTATMLFLFLILKRYYKYAFLVFIFPLVFAYSRIYLSLHFPGDILVGYIAGIVMGTLCYKLYQFAEKKYIF